MLPPFLSPRLDQSQYELTVENTTIYVPPSLILSIYFFTDLKQYMVHLFNETQ